MQPIEPPSVSQVVLTIAQYGLLVPLLLSGALAVWRALAESLHSGEAPAREGATQRTQTR